MGTCHLPCCQCQYQYVPMLTKYLLAAWLSGSCPPSTHSIVPRPSHLPLPLTASTCACACLPGLALAFWPATIPNLPKPNPNHVTGLLISYFKSLSNHHLALSLSLICFTSLPSYTTDTTPPYQFFPNLNSLRSVLSMDSALLPGYKSATFSILFLQ